MDNFSFHQNKKFFYWHAAADLSCRHMSLLHRRAYLGHFCPYETHQIGRGDTQLQTAYAGADIYVAVLHACSVYVCREPLFHTYGRTPAAYVSCRREQILHVEHLDSFVARDLCRGLQVDLVVARYHAYYMSRTVAG